MAGSETAFHLAESGLKVRLYEMRPAKMTDVHQSGNMGELVCSNSLKSELINTAQGLLKAEMQRMGSLILSCAEQARVPAGSALAVDRERFSKLVNATLENHPNIEIVRQEVTRIPLNEITIIATGPLTSGELFEDIKRLTGSENLYFYDAVAPSISMESLDTTKAFKASRYGKGTEDYYNCPMNKQEYERFYYELIDADIKEGHSIDKKEFFDGCMPVEVMARRGVETLRFGPMRPVGLLDPVNGKRPWAVVQLRQENREGTVWGLVGCQTRLKWAEQKRVFQLIPGLENADFVRFGVMHRNTFICSPQLLQPTLQLKSHPNLLFAGQITGVEGYMESAATGILAGVNAKRIVHGQEPLSMPPETILGALVQFITQADQNNFQPINANFGIVPPLSVKIKNKKERYNQYVSRSMDKMNDFSELFAAYVVK